MAVQHDYKNVLIVQIAISPAGVVMNVLLLIGLFIDPVKCFRNSGTYFVGNLALSDCLVCLFTTFGHVIKTYVGETSWSEIEDFLWLTFSAVSHATIISISIDRFFMVVYPLQHRYWMKGKTMATWLACIWLVSVIYPAKKLAFENGRYDKLVGTFFGLTVILSSAAIYGVTYFKLRKQTRNSVFDESANTNRRVYASRMLKEKKFLTTIIVIASIHVVCMVPFLILYQLVILPGLLEEPLAQIIMIICSSLFYCNFSVNPFIYVARLTNYRKTFYLLYCRSISNFLLSGNT